MKQLDYMSVAEEAMSQISNGGGAFLTVKNGDNVNTMTIGWALIGVMWGKPIMTVAVRKSRHTFRIMENASDFNVSVPRTDMAKELEFCGSRSGRDCNKFEECGIKLRPAEKVQSPLIDIPGMHFECKIALRSPMNPQLLIDEYVHLYPGKDYHTLYFGEILDCYSI